MANELRTRDGLPFNFVDGLRIKGVDVTNWEKIFIDQGASYVGFTPVGNLAATNVQAAIAELESEKQSKSEPIANATTAVNLRPGANQGIVWDNDAFGGTQDTASITLETASGEATKMRFRMTNDSDDNFEFTAKTADGLTSFNNAMTLNGNVLLNAANYVDYAAPMIADYVALRAYTGSATQVRITSNGLSGFFYRDDADTTSLDNGGTVIVASNGKRWKRIYNGAVNVSWFGAKGDGVADDTATIQAAVAATNATGQWLLWNVGTYRITNTLAFTLPKMRWKSEGAVIFVDTPGDILRGVDVTLAAGVDHQLIGEGFEVNANGKCHGALRFQQTTGTQTASLYLVKTGARNAEMQVGAGVGSSCLDVRGGFRSVKLVDCYAENIMMRTSAGVLGSSGVTGIIVQSNFGTAGAYAKNMILVRPAVRRVYSQDAAYQADMDGIGLFANPDTDSSLGPSYAEVTSPDISGCWGRDIKMQVSASKVDSPTSLRNEGPSGGINNAAYDFQTGPGVLLGGQYTIDGVTCTITGSICRFGVGVTGSPMSSRWDGGAIDIINGAVMPRVMSSDTSTTVTKTVATASNVSVKGAIENFLWLRTNGFDINIAKLDGVVCESVTDALVRVEAGSGGSAPYRGRVYVKNCINLGSDVPTVRCNVPGNGAFALLDDVGGIGFGPASVTHSSSAQTVSGLSVDQSSRLPIPLNSGNNSGSEKLYSFSLTAGGEITLPGHGYSSNYLAEINMAIFRTSYAYLSVDANGITTIFSGSSTQIGTTSDPGSGDLRVWRNTGTNQLIVKNGSAATRLFFVRFIG